MTGSLLLGFGLWAVVAHGLQPLSDAPVFASLFQGGAVLQREATVSVWGTVASGGPVALYVDSRRVADAVVDTSGNWSAELVQHAASFRNVLTAVGPKGNSSVVVSFGDVVLCAGQSNMDMPVTNKPGAFQADNGTAEAAAASRYTGGIWLWRQVQSKYRNPVAWEAASEKVISSSHSAVCWYTGKNYFDHLGGKVPVGLMQASVGGSPIEYWLSKESIAKCEIDQPRCDTQLDDSAFYDDQVTSLQPYTFGALVWDQAERDLKCNHVEKYPCMQRELASSWRSSFKSPNAAFVVIQLPDYFDPKDPGAAGVPGFNTTAEGLFNMRLAQEQGLEGVEKAAAVATYDQSCNDLAFKSSCPFGSVHNIHKQLVGERVAAQLIRLMRGEEVVTEGPRAVTTSAAPVGNSSGYSVTVRFAGGSLPFMLKPTRNCTECCDGTFGTKASGDFDASSDGITWALGKNVRMKDNSSVVFHVPMDKAPAFVRYTAGSNFTQCALYNKEALPAWPFQMKVAAEVNTIVV